MSDKSYVVVEKPCKWEHAEIECSVRNEPRIRYADGGSYPLTRCLGCIGDGTRLDVETRIEVEPADGVTTGSGTLVRFALGEFWRPLSVPSTDSKKGKS